MKAIDLRNHLDKTLPQTSYKMREAVVDVLAGGFTWREAARRREVTESGILRAMQRSKIREILSRECKPY